MNERIPAHIDIYVRALGREQALAFILKFGGTLLYLSDSPGKASSAAQMVGAAGVRAIKDELRRRNFVNDQRVKVPVANKWAAGELARNGLNKSEIARMLRTDIATVRRWINGGGWKKGNVDQLALFED